MATIFRRTSEKGIILTLSEKADLGQFVKKKFISSGYSQSHYTSSISFEPEGYFQVIEYPESFIIEIDKCIDKFLYLKEVKARRKVPVTRHVTKRQRKRIPIRKELLRRWSSKPTGKEGSQNG